MDTSQTNAAGPQAESASTLTAVFRRAWHGIRDRIVGGLLIVLPILITFWFIHWAYTGLEKYVIDPLALVVLWKVQGRSDTELPYWFENYAAPVIAIIVALIVLYCFGFLVRSRLRRGIDWALLRVPVISIVYNGVRNVFHALEQQRGQKRPQRVVLVDFPHPGMKAAAFVTATCRDLKTQKVILCVYVPTAPMPTGGYLLLVPEEEVTELNWSLEETLQTIISGGLTASPEVSYFKTLPSPELNAVATRGTREVRPGQPDDA
jgi:uncharacterized membrane protein